MSPSKGKTIKARTVATSMSALPKHICTCFCACTHIFKHNTLHHNHHNNIYIILQITNIVNYIYIFPAFKGIAFTVICKEFKMQGVILKALEGPMLKLK